MSATLSHRTPWAASLREQCPDATIISIACDLSSFESTRSAAAELNYKFASTGLDVLCNNAGVMALPDEATGDGFDVQIQTNHLSHFLLTSAVFPLLEAAASKRGEARIVNHSSLARVGVALDERYFGPNGGALGGNGASMFFGGARWVRYHHSKLANAVFTQALHRKLTNCARLKGQGAVRSAWVCRHAATGDGFGGGQIN